MSVHDIAEKVVSRFSWNFRRGRAWPFLWANSSTKVANKLQKLTKLQPLFANFTFSLLGHKTYNSICVHAKSKVPGKVKLGYIIVCSKA